MDSIANALIELWFGDWSDSRPAPEGGDPIVAQWWVKDPNFDEHLRATFGDAHEAAIIGELGHWAATARGCMALSLLLDQVSRNIHRGTARSFAADVQARTLTHQVMGGPIWNEMPPIWRLFIAMPLMHSESLADHDLAVKTFEALAAQTAGTERASNYENTLKFEHKHRDIIVKFGRYPHRNDLLGRSSTEEERQFLTQPGSSF